VLRNLIDNALIYQDGQARVCVEEDEERPLIAVEDTGIGMEPAQVPQLFDAFEQASTGMDRSHESSSLGLMLACNLVDRMGGSIAVDPAKGEGTQATVRRSPGGAATAAEDEADHRENESRQRTEAAAGTRVLSELQPAV